jgi:hypothetical protein
VGIISSVFGAVWPVFTQYVVARTQVPKNNSGQINGFMELSRGSESQRRPQSTFTLWKYICCVSLSCSVIVFGAVFVSKEPEQISQNFYVHGVLFQWLLLQVPVGFFRFIFFCSTLLLINGACATTTNFVIVLAYPSQMAIFDILGSLIFAEGRNRCLRCFRSLVLQEPWAVLGYSPFLVREAVASLAQRTFPVLHSLARYSHNPYSSILLY